MVVALRPGKFYGSSLPRPRFYTDVEFNSDRVDPPTPLMDPLLSWANEAHWSMGGLSFNRHRLQGRIEGSIKKLRTQQERTARMTSSESKKRSVDKISSLDSVDCESSQSESESESEKEEKVEVVVPSSITRRKRARKLVDEFEMVAAEKEKKPKEVEDRMPYRTRSRRSGPVEPTESPAASGGNARRTSPRKSMA